MLSRSILWELYKRPSVRGGRGRLKTCVALFAVFSTLATSACSDPGDGRERALLKLRADYLERLDVGLTIGDHEERRREIGNVCGMLVAMYYTESAADFDQLRSWDPEERMSAESSCVRVTLSRVEE